MLLSVSPETLAMLKELLLVLAGAISAIFGGFLATLYQAKKARKIRREEVIGEKQVAVYNQAASLIYSLQGLLIQATLSDVIKFMHEHKDWFWDNIVFLPPKFRDKWLSIRLALNKAVRIEKQQGPDKVAELTSLETYLDKLAKEAEVAILNELNMPSVKIERFSEAETDD